MSLAEAASLSLPLFILNEERSDESKDPYTCSTLS
jgi:hypothetical protein